MAKPLPTYERVRELFNYDPLTGIVTRRVGVNQFPVGSAVGYVMPARNTAYYTVSIDGTKCRLHRVIFFYMTGRWPLVVDHINWDGLDNRWCNLRDVTPRENALNQRPITKRSTARSGFIGVCQSNRTGRWQARINHFGKEIWLGTFGTPEEARAAYVAKARELGVPDGVVAA